MASRLARLEGGRYDGDRTELDLDHYPPAVWAWNCPHYPKGCKVEVHWSIVPDELAGQMLSDCERQGIEALLYEKDRLERDQLDGRIYMVYIQVDLKRRLEGENEWIDLGTTSGEGSALERILSPA